MERHELVGHGFRLQRATEKVDGALFCTKGRSLLDFSRSYANNSVRCFFLFKIENHDFNGRRVGEGRGASR